MPAVHLDLGKCKGLKLLITKQDGNRGVFLINYMSRALWRPLHLPTWPMQRAGPGALLIYIGVLIVVEFPSKNK